MHLSLFMSLVLQLIGKFLFGQRPAILFWNGRKIIRLKYVQSITKWPLKETCSEKEKSKKNIPILSIFLSLKNLQIQTDVSIATSEKLVTVESIPPDFNWAKYDRFALPDRESGEPVLVFMNLALAKS